MAELTDATTRVEAASDPDSVHLRVVAEARPHVKLGDATLRPDELLTIRATDVILVDRWTDGVELTEGERVAFRLHDAVAIRGVLVEVDGEVGVLVQQVLLQ